MRECRYSQVCLIYNLMLLLSCLNIMFSVIHLTDYEDTHFIFSSFILLQLLAVFCFRHPTNQCCSNQWWLLSIWETEFLLVLCSDFPHPTKQRIVLLSLLKMDALSTGKHNGFLTKNIMHCLVPMHSDCLNTERLE